MKGFAKLINFYATSLSSEISTAATGSFSVVSKSVDGYTLEDGEYRFTVVVDLANSTTRELFRIWKVSGNVLYYDKRISPNGILTHAIGKTIQINSVSETINDLTANVDNFGETEIDTGLQLKVAGGYVKYKGEHHTITSQTVNATDNAISYIVLDYADNTVKAITEAAYPTYDGYGVAKVTASGGTISSLEDVRGVILDSRGDDGTDGNTVLSGTSDPTTQGVDGDFYINTTTNQIFGPKTAGAWGTGTDIKGDAGDNGADGVDGATILVGIIDPTAGDGAEGDYFFNKVSNDFFGPKSALDNWPLVGNLKGEPGDIADAPEGTAQTISTDVLPPTGSVVTYAGGTLTIEYPGSKIYFNYTTSGYTITDTFDVVLYTYSGTGTVVGDYIEYADFKINTTTGGIRISGVPAYTNTPNYFLESNIFGGPLHIEGPAIFGLMGNVAETTTLDIANGSKQYVPWSVGHTLNMSNIINGTTLIFVIDNTSGGDIVLTLGTFSKLGGGTYTPYSIGGTTYPLTLSAGLHFFVSEVFSSGIHITYAGKSVAA